MRGVHTIAITSIYIYICYSRCCVCVRGRLLSTHALATKRNPHTHTHTHITVQRMNIYRANNKAAHCGRGGDGGGMARGVWGGSEVAEGEMEMRRTLRFWCVMGEGGRSTVDGRRTRTRTRGRTAHTDDTEETVSV